MSQGQHNKSGDMLFQAIMAALATCYGNLAEPNFRKVYVTMGSSLHRNLIEELRGKGIKITETTDENDDVSNHLVLDCAGDHVGLALSGVGPYAALVHWDEAERRSWVTQPENAPTPLAALVAQTVQHAGFQLLDRSLVSRTIKMNWHDGSEEVTLYQALFTDSDVIP